MANTDPELAKAAQLAYERSNASLGDYNPHELDDEKKVVEVVPDAPLEPVLPTAENVATADASSSKSSKSDK